MEIIFRDTTTILVQVKRMNFSFLIDTSIKYNLMEPCFLELFHEEYPPLPLPLLVERQRIVDEYKKLSDDAFPILPNGMPDYLFLGVYNEVGTRKIRCKDGVSRLTKTVQFNFDIKDESYSELFCIDKSLCTYFTKKNQVVAILGTEFLSRHGWIVDFKNKTILTK